MILSVPPAHARKPVGAEEVIVTRLRIEPVHIDLHRLDHTTAAQASVWGVWGSGPNDVWAVGNAGIRHFDGNAWSSSPAHGRFRGVWGSGAGDVWVTSGRAIFHHQ